MEFGSPEFWAGLMKIIGINIILSGDNAVVIALAARSLPPEQQKKAIWWGAAGAIVFRILLTFFAAALLELPYLKLVGAALLLWIGVQLLLPEKEDHGGEAANTGFWGALKTIFIADLVMSLDNVIAVAAAAKGSLTLLIIGLGISIPLVIYGSTMLLKVMERFPVIITIGGGLLGFVAGEMVVTDPALADWMANTFQQVNGHSVVGGIKLDYIAGAIGAIIVIIIGKTLAKRHLEAEKQVDLA